MPKVKVSFIVLFIGLILSVGVVGCAYKSLDTHAYDSLVVGQTTRSQAIQLLGQPNLDSSSGVVYDHLSNANGDDCTITLLFDGNILYRKDITVYH
jgi:hypothetical protein